MDELEGNYHTVSAAERVYIQTYVPWSFTASKLADMHRTILQHLLLLPVHLHVSNDFQKYKYTSTNAAKGSIHWAVGVCFVTKDQTKS